MAKNLKDTDPLKYRARSIRSSLLGRLRKLARPDLKDDTPTIPEIETWLTKWDGKCYYFKTNIGLLKCHIDHKIPIKRGGTNEFKNLCVTHPHANLAKGDMTETEFNQILRIISKWDDKGKSLLNRLKQGKFSGRRYK